MPLLENQATRDKSQLAVVVTAECYNILVFVAKLALVVKKITYILGREHTVCKPYVNTFTCY